MDNLEEIIKTFHKNGIGVVPNFATAEECDKMIERMKEITSQIRVEDHIQNLFITESGLKNIIKKFTKNSILDLDFDF